MLPLFPRTFKLWMFLSKGTPPVNRWLNWIMCDLSWNVLPYWAVFIASFNGDEPPMSTAGFCWINLKLWFTTYNYMYNYHSTVFLHHCNVVSEKHFNDRYPFLWTTLNFLVIKLIFHHTCTFEKGEDKTAWGCYRSQMSLWLVKRISVDIGLEKSHTIHILPLFTPV